MEIVVKLQFDEDKYDEVNKWLKEVNEVEVILVNVNRRVKSKEDSQVEVLIKEEYPELEFDFSPPYTSIVNYIKNDRRMKKASKTATGHKIVNHIRHTQTNYELMMSKTKNKKNQHRLKCVILDLIAEYYPKLEKYCNHQKTVKK